MDSPPLGIMRPPLPEEIQKMSEEETACQYCGISYLLLTKYESMQNHVARLELQLKELQGYAQETPLLKQTIEHMKQQEKESAKTISHLYSQLEQEQSNHTESTRQFSLQLQQQEKDRKILQTQYDQLQSLHQQTTHQNQRYRHALEIIRTSSIELKKSQTAIREEWIECIRSTRKEFQTLVPQCTNQIQHHYESYTQHMQSTTNGLMQKTMDKLEQDFKVQLQQARLEKNNAQQELSQLQRSSHDTIQTLTDCLEEMKQKADSLVKDKNQALEDYQDMKNMKTEFEKEVLRLTSSQRQTVQQFHSRIEQLQHQLDETTQNYLNEKQQCQEWKLKCDSEKRSSETGNSALDAAHKGLAIKENKIKELEHINTSLKTELEKAKQERSKTIEAHQSRIKQLQDKFLQDIEQAKSGEVSKTIAQLENEFQSQKEKAIQQALDENNQKHQQEINELQSSLQRFKHDKNKSQQDQDHLEHQIKILESHNVSINQELILFKQKLGSLEQQYQQTVSQLNNLQPQSQAWEAEKSNFQSLIKKKENEIEFLKRTVRVECEERMGLLALLEKMRRSHQDAPPIHLKPSPSLPSIHSKPSIDSLAKTPSPCPSEPTLSKAAEETTNDKIRRASSDTYRRKAPLVNRTQGGKRGYIPPYLLKPNQG